MIDFPKVSLSGAVAPIKSAVPRNIFVQECFVPESAGGSVDILLGIQYASLFPKLVHMLPCGLGFYKLKLEAPGVGFNGCKCLKLLYKKFFYLFVSNPYFEQ